ncbi:carboxypeptidase-like regulatory domain-containing protein [Salinimicrobium flavum]|uniref:Carboxypeptidase-like regulatory domain-containing protein n=1 Tax=Salinimicrobium flavum TaxID=1737065 RepID=A0ABW5J1C3_9FLAO
MKKINHTRRLILILLMIFVALPVSLSAENFPDLTTKDIIRAEYFGKVVSSRNGQPLASAYLSVNGTNISTVTNNDGEFSLKVPDNLTDVTVTVSHLGYRSKTLPLDYFRGDDVVVELDESMEELSEVAIFTYTDPQAVVKNMLRNRGSNYFTESLDMTAFYRETIKRGRKNVSLSEAVVTIHKTPYSNTVSDKISLIKARKTADYDRLDTLALKLRGGPYNTVNIDLMKNPDFMFRNEGLNNYKFSFDPPTRINDRYLYVVNFEELAKDYPWYFGKLYIDAENFTLVKGSFNLNVDNRAAATALFVKKKPGGTKVYPISVHYDIEYRERDGRWYFGYGKTDLEFVVNWKRRLFNSRYRVNSELAVTDWQPAEGKFKRDENYINPNIVMIDDVSGFADVAFWGENNIIEPDESIEKAIDKIRKNLEENNQL